MAKYTVQDIKTRVQRTFGDEADTQIDTNDIVRWINDGQREAVLQTEGLLETTFTLNMTININTYPLDSTLFALHRVRVRSSTSEAYSFIPWMNGVDFERYIDGWDGSTDRGIPAVYTEKDHNLVVFPTPDRTLTSGFKYEGSKYPTDVAVLGDTHSLLEYYNQYLVDYCLMQAYELDEDIEAAATKGSAVQQSLDFNEGRENWFGRDKYPVVQSYSMDDDY